MKKIFVALAALSLLVIGADFALSDRASPQGGNVVSVTATSGGGATVAGTPAKPTVGLLTSCSTNEVLKWSGSAWACGAAGAGTVTNVSTVAPIQGGPITTTGSISLIACATNEVYRWNGAAFVCAIPTTALTCGAGQHFSATTAAGVFTCSADAGGVTGSGTAGKATRWTGTSAIADASAFDDGTTLTPQALAGTVISPAAISGTTSDWNPTGLSTATIIRVAVTGTTSLTGIVAPSASRVLVLHNIGSGTLNLIHDSTSTTANRLYALDGRGGSITVDPDKSFVLVYDMTTARWRAVSYPAFNSVLGASCGAGSFVSSITSSTGGGTCTAESGDITDVVAGNGLTGGASSGTATVDVACLTGLTCAANDISITARDFGDVTTTTSGSVWTIDNNVVTYAKMQDVSATNRLLCRITAGAGDMEECTGTQATGLLSNFTSGAQGVVSASGGGTVNYARADGTWAAPPGLQTGSGTANTLAMWTGTNALGNSLLTQASNALTIGTSGASGGTTINVGANNFTVNTTAAGNAFIASGVQMQFHNGYSDSYFCQGGGNDDYFRPCGAAGIVYIADVGTGGVQLGNASSNTTVSGNLGVAGTTTFGDSGTGDKVIVKGGEFADGGAAPSSGTCGTSPTYGGGRFAFKVTAGTGAPTTCAVNFSTALDAAPSACTVTAVGTAKAVYFTTAPTASAVTFANTGGDSMQGITYNVICVGDG